MDDGDLQRTDPRRDRRRLALLGVVAVVVLVGAAAWFLRSPDEIPVGTERAVTVEVDDCGEVSVDVGGQRWSTMGAGPADPVQSYGRGPEPGVFRRDTTDEATFTSDLVDGSVTLQRHGRVVVRHLSCLIMP